MVDARKLEEGLLAYGYFIQDVKEISAAYQDKGIEAAVAAFAWADDEEHDYSGELRGVIEEIEKSA